MTTTTNLGLTTYSVASGSATTFLTFRTALAGTSSNMNLIDNWVGSASGSIISLTSNEIIDVNASQISANYYEATVSLITSYATNLKINLKVNATNTGAVTIQINSLGVKTLKKVNSAGTLVDVAASDIVANAYNLCTYNGTYFVLLGSLATGSISGSYIGTSPIVVTGSTISHAVSGIVSGSYNQISVDSLGHITSGSIVASSGTTYTGSAIITVSGSKISHNVSGIASGSYNAVVVDLYGHIISGCITATAGMSSIAGSTIMSDTSGSVVKHNISAVSPNTYLAANITVDQWGHITSAANGTSASSVGAPSDSPFLTTGSSASLTNYKILSAGSNIQFLDSGGAISINTIDLINTYIPTELTINGTNKLTITDNARFNGYVSVEKMSNGNLIIAYEGGTYGQHNTGIIYGKTSPDYGQTWSSEFTIFQNTSGSGAEQFGITSLESGRILVPLCFANSSNQDRLLDNVYLIHSDDFGVTWSSPSRVTDSTFTDNSIPSGKMVQLNNGTILMPVEGKDTGDSYYSCRILQSSDDGDTWGNEIVLVSGTRDYFETCLLQLYNGEVIAFSRTAEEASSNTYITKSLDNGSTWNTPSICFPAIGMPNTIHLSSGILVSTPRLSSYQMGVEVSLDNGSTWHETTLDDSGVIQQYACPVEISPNVVAIVYCYEPTSGNGNVYIKWISFSTDMTNLNYPALNVGFLGGHSASDFSLGGTSSVIIEHDGSSQGTASIINFTGDGVSAGVSGSTATVSISGGSGSGISSFDYIYILDKYSAGGGGLQFDAGAWRTRTLTTESVDDGNHASLHSNQITLDSGTYRCSIRCPAWRVADNVARLYNASGSSVLLFGTAAYSPAASTSQSDSWIIGQFVLSVQSVLEIQHQCYSTYSLGFGDNYSFDADTIYTTAEFWKTA